jgi:hypothetical protein
MREPSADDMPSEGSRQEAAPLLQWIGFFLAPAAFFAHMQIGYVVVPWACATHGDAWMHVIGLAALALAATGMLAAWRTWMRAGRDVPGESGGALPRTRFLGAIGLGMSAIITLVIFAQWIASFFISTCQ